MSASDHTCARCGAVVDALTLAHDCKPLTPDELAASLQAIPPQFAVGTKIFCVWPDGTNSVGEITSIDWRDIRFKGTDGRDYIAPFGASHVSLLEDVINVEVTNKETAADTGTVEAKISVPLRSTEQHDLISRIRNGTATPEDIALAKRNTDAAVAALEDLFAGLVKAGKKVEQVEQAFSNEMVQNWRRWAGEVLDIDPEAEPAPSDGKLRELIEAQAQRERAESYAASIKQAQTVRDEMREERRVINAELGAWTNWAYNLIMSASGEECEEMEDKKLRELLTGAINAGNLNLLVMRDSAYTERNKVVAALARMAKLLQWPAGIGRHELKDGEQPWPEDWQNVIYIDLPSGQVSWHINDRELYLFTDLPKYKGKWDGHDVSQKYGRLAQIREVALVEIALSFGIPDREEAEDEEEPLSGELDMDEEEN